MKSLRRHNFAALIAEHDQYVTLAIRRDGRSWDLLGSGETPAQSRADALSIATRLPAAELARDFRIATYTVTE